MQNIELEVWILSFGSGAVGRQILAKAEYALGIFDIGSTIVFEIPKNLLGLM